MHKRAFINFSLLFLLLAFLSCAQQSDKDSVNDLINGNASAFFNPFGEMNESGGDAGGFSAVLGGDAYIYPWWREFKLPPDNRLITIQVAQDIANVTVSDELTGHFYVDTTDDGILNPGEKEMHHSGLINGEFIHDPNHQSPYSNKYGWYLAKISAYEFRMYDQSKQTVEIESIRVHTADESFDKTYTDPGQLYDVETEVPRFQVGDVVYVDVTCSNSSTQGWDPPTFVYLHYNTDSRDLFTDTGDHQHFTGSWVPQSVGVHHACVDVIDSACIQNETEDDYNATAWALPYIVE
jgi:hypothetical protein